LINPGYTREFISLEIGDLDMKIKSVSGITVYVKNLNKTTKFYEALGFDIKKKEENHVTAYSNWFWIDFLAIDKDDRTGFAKARTRKTTALECSFT
jgi:catechol 2,3-dioxygenase-like lactoylglutathione lyase family enzyme